MVIIFFSTFLLFYFFLQTTVEFKPNWSWAEVNRSCNHHLKSISICWTVMLLTILAKKISIDDDTGTSRKYRRQENRYLKCTFNKASAILDTVNINKFTVELHVDCGSSVRMHLRYRQQFITLRSIKKSAPTNWNAVSFPPGDATGGTADFSTGGHGP